MEDEFGLLSKELALNLDISTSNLRKWSLLIEAEGYVFERNTNNQRIYYERDINMLEDLKKHLSRERDVHNAVKTVVKRHLELRNAKDTLGVIRNKNGIKNGNIAITEDFVQSVINSATQEMKAFYEDVITGNQQQYEDNLKKMQEHYEGVIKDILSRVPSEKDKRDELQLKLDLREEAIKDWENQPENVRFKTSLLGLKKDEDSIKRNEHIERYTNQKLLEHYDQLDQDTKKISGT